MVTSDRLSAFDVVLDEPIPHKGRVLTAISAFWFEALGDVAGSHLVSTDLADLPDGVAAADPDLAGRIMLCRKAEMLPIECIVRGYLTGSAWKEYRTSGTMHGQALPAGPAGERRSSRSRCSRRRPRATCHDENISFDAGRRPRRRGARRRGPATSRSSCTARGAELAARARDHHRRHQVRARPRRRRAGAVRRGADPRLQPRSGRPTSGSPASRRRASTSSRCATTSRRSTGTRTRRRRRCPPRSSPPPAPATSRPTSASPAARFADWPGVA